MESPSSMILAPEGAVAGGGVGAGVAVVGRTADAGGEAGCGCEGRAAWEAGSDSAAGGPSALLCSLSAPLHQESVRAGLHTVIPPHRHSQSIVALSLRGTCGR